VARAALCIHRIHHITSASSTHPLIQILLCFSQFISDILGIMSAVLLQFNSIAGLCLRASPSFFSSSARQAWCYLNFNGVFADGLGISGI
jgi:hypothetical protein